MDNKIDKTKEKIGVSNLDDKSRKELFNKFVDAGGKVVIDKSKKNITIDRKRQKQISKEFEERRKNAVSKNITAKPIKKVQHGQQAQIPSRPVFSNFMAEFRIRFKLWYMGIAELNGQFFNLKFLEKFHDVYAASLMSLQIIYFDIFKRNPPLGTMITEKLDGISLYYSEVMQMISAIYDKPLFDRILNDYVNFDGTPVKTLDLKEQLLLLYKKLYILFPYQALIVSGFELALETLLKNEKISGKAASIKKLKNDINNIFYRLYPQLHWLFCHYEGGMYAEYDPAVEKILKISEEEKPGRRKIMKKEAEQPVIEEEKPEEVKVEKKGMPDHVKKGMGMMFRLDMKKLRAGYDRAGLFENIGDNDKILLVYLLFREFDNEYSFILTTNKIKYNLEFGRSSRADYRSKMSLLFEEMRKCSEGFKNYIENVSLYNKAREQKPVGNTQFIEYSKRLEALSQKKNEAARSVRMTVRAFMGRVETDFKVLLDDMNANTQQYITNPQDVLEFNTEIEGDKKISNLKIFEAIEMVYCFCSAFYFRLGLDGDLGEGTEFEGEAAPEKVFSEEYESIMAVEPKKEQPEKDEKKSLLDELDDMI